jgi:hypothetical protein
MSDGDEYRRFAERIMRLADEAKSPNVKARLLEVANEWFKLAVQAEWRAMALLGEKKPPPNRTP